jgi:hypothetical protein
MPMPITEAYVKAQLGGRLGIGANIPTVQETFRAIYNLGSDFASDGRQFDQTFAAPQPYSTVAEQRASNVHLAGKTEDAFVAMREGAPYWRG